MLGRASYARVARLARSGRPAGFSPCGAARRCDVQCAAVSERLLNGARLSAIAGLIDLKPPAPQADPEVLAHIEKALGPLDTRPLVRRICGQSGVATAASPACHQSRSQQQRHSPQRTDCVFAPASSMHSPLNARRHSHSGAFSRAAQRLLGLRLTPLSPCRCRPHQRNPSSLSSVVPVELGKMRCSRGSRSSARTCTS